MERDLSIDLKLFREAIPGYNKLAGRASEAELGKIVYFAKKKMGTSTVETWRFWFKNQESGKGDVPTLVFASKNEATLWLLECKKKIESEKVGDFEPIPFPSKLFAQLTKQIDESNLPNV